MTFVSVLLDVLLAATVVICVVLGFKRGFVRSVVQMIGSVTAFLVSFFISGPLAQGLFNWWFRGSVYDAVSGAIGVPASTPVASLQGEWGSVFERLPDLLRNGLTVSGVHSADTLGTTVSEHGATTAGEAANVLVDQLIAPICVVLLQIVIFLVLFAVAAFLIRFLGKMLDAVFSAVPLIKQLNTVLGGAAGLLRGAVLVIVLCAILHMYMTLAGPSSVVTEADLNATWWTQGAMNANPLF